MRVLIFGMVDNGKSTVGGRLLYNVGQVTEREFQVTKENCLPGWEYAGLLDVYQEERLKGKTVDCTEFTVNDITFIDTPGHGIYLPKLIPVCQNVDCALWVVSCLESEFETSCTHSLEHLLIVRGLGINRLVIALNKSDLAKDLEAMEIRIKKVAQRCAFTSISVVPISAYHNHNLDRLLETIKNLGSREIVAPHKEIENPSLDILVFSPLLTVGFQAELCLASETESRMITLEKIISEGKSVPFVRKGTKCRTQWSGIGSVKGPVSIIIRHPEKNSTIAIGKIEK